MPRGPSGGYYQDGPPGMPRSRRMYRGGLSDIIMETGRARAGIQERMGADLAEGIGRVGEGIAGAVEERSRAEAMARRDAAVVADLQNWNGDPKALLASMVKRLGPVDGPKMAQAVMSFQELGNQQDDREVQRLKDVGETAAKVPFPMFQTLWNTMRTKAPVFEKYLGMQPGSLPEEATPELHEAVKSIFGPGPAAPVKLGPNEILGDPGTGRTLLENRPPREEKPDSRSIEARLAEAAASGDTETVNRLLSVAGRQAAATRAPREPRDPLYQAKEVLNDEGKAVMANFDSRSGRYIDTASGKPINNPRPVPSAAETQDSRKFQQAGPILRSVEELSERINTLQGVYAKAAGETARAQAKVNLDDDVAEYEALVEGFTPLVARSLGHTGVLTQQDVDSVKKLFPRPGDSKSLRDRKVKRIKSIIGELESGAAPGGTDGNQAVPRGGLPRVASDSDFDALPSGAEFIDPEGRRRRKP